MRCPVESFYGCPRRRDALDTPRRADDGALAKIAFRKNSANAAYGAITLNADMINSESGYRKLPAFRRKSLDSGRFPSSKTTVKYKRRFLVNPGTVHFAGGRHLAYSSLSRYFRHLTMALGVFERFFAILCIVEKGTPAGPGQPPPKYAGAKYA
jgi:hypothetical protein